MDVGFLQPVYRTEGPCVTVYLHGSPVVPRWLTLRERLRGDGADDDTLAALDDRMLTGPVDGAVDHGRAMVAAAGHVLLDRPLPPAGPDAADLVAHGARWAPLPHLVPLLAARGRPVPHVVVVADQVGADIHLGDDGRSHRRFRQRDGHRWTHNAALVADAVFRLAVRHGARLVMLAGDTHARHAISEALPPAVQALVVETAHGGRTSTPDPLRAEVLRVLAQRDRDDHAKAVARFVRHRGRHDRAAEGLEATISALRTGQVATLLLCPTASPRQHVWVGPHPDELAVTRSELERLGVEEYASDRADAALLRASVATHAEVELLGPDDPEVVDGMAGLLRRTR